MSDWDNAARKLARTAQTGVDHLNRQVQDLSSKFGLVVSSINQLEKEVALLRAEFSPKTLDKSPRLPLPPRQDS